MRWGWGAVASAAAVAALIALPAMPAAAVGEVVAIPVTGAAAGIGVSPDGSRVYVLTDGAFTSEDNHLRVFDTTTDPPSLLGFDPLAGSGLELSADIAPLQMVVDAQTGLIGILVDDLVTSSPVFAIVDPQTGVLFSGEVTVDNGTTPPAMVGAMAFAEGRLWLSAPLENLLLSYSAVVGPSLGDFQPPLDFTTATDPLSNGVEEPFGLAASADGLTLFVSGVDAVTVQQRIVSVTLPSTLTASLAQFGQAPQTISVGADGRIYATDFADPTVVFAVTFGSPTVQTYSGFVGALDAEATSETLYVMDCDCGGISQLQTVPLAGGPTAVTLSTSPNMALVGLVLGAASGAGQFAFIAGFDFDPLAPVSFLYVVRIADPDPVLPETGAEAAPILALGGALLLAGAVAIAAYRIRLRRSRASSSGAD